MNISADRLNLTQLSEGIAVFEASGVDMYSEGITDEAFAFKGVEYSEVPVEMEFVRVRINPGPPARVPRDATVFEFYETDVVSDGGMVVVSKYGIAGGHEVKRSLGFIVASGCESYRGPLPSGNSWRSEQAARESP